jgi:hypothetical protein
MWNPFAKQKRLSDDEILSLAAVIAKPLQVQLSIAVRIGPPAGAPHRRALGYVYGWSDAALRVRGWDMADTAIGPPVLFHVLRHLWRGDEARLLHHIVAHLRDPVVVSGMMHGGQQYLDWRSQETPYPTGLGQCLSAAD